MKLEKIALTGFLLVAAIFIASTCIAATEVSTFESFYQSKGTPNLWLAAAFAVVAGGLIFVTGGTASPVVAGIGGWIGGIMGYSGIAATNAGLALLGGGSIASGGFGIAGGVALLTAALTFSTEVVFDYGINQAITAYDKKAFVEASSKMTKLPLPTNDSGPASVKAAMKVLKNADQKTPLNTPQNSAVLKSAVGTLKAQIGNANKKNDELREQSLYALLSYLVDDYTTARKSASSAYKLAIKSEQRATVPAFVYSISELYQQTPNVNKAYDYFAYAVTKEQDTQLRPFLFAAFLDRAIYRMGDDGVSHDILDRLYALTQGFKTDKNNVALQSGIVSRYFILLKLEQQKIITLSETKNQTVKKHPRTLSSVKTSYKHYSKLINQSKRVIDNQQKIALNQVKKHRIYKPDWENKWLEKVQNDLKLWQAYRVDKGNLLSQVEKLERFQAVHAKNGGAGVIEIDNIK